MIRLLIVAIVSTFLLIPIAGFSSNIIENEILLIIVCFTTGYIIVPAILLRLWPERQGANDPDTLESALEKGLVSTHEFSVSEAVEIEESEDEGLHFLLSISATQTLSLAGQYLYPYAGLPGFPSTKIRLFTHIENKCCYGIECIGSKLESVTTIEAASLEAWEAEVVPYDMEIIEKPIKDIVSQIQKYN